MIVVWGSSSARITFVSPMVRSEMPRMAATARV